MLLTDQRNKHIYCYRCA